MKDASTRETIDTTAKVIAPLTSIEAVQEAALIAMDSDEWSPLANKTLALLRRIYELDSFFFLVCHPETGIWTHMLQGDIIAGEFKSWEEQDISPQDGNPLFKRIREGEPRLVLRQADDAANPNFVSFGDKSRRSRSLMFAPMLYHGAGRGLLSVQSYKPNAYTPKDLELLGAIASIIGGALPRIQAEKSLQKSEAIYRMAIENISGVPYRLHYQDSQYDFIGKGVEKLFGIPAEEFGYSRFRQIVKEIVVIDPEAPSDPYEYGKAYRQGEYNQFRVDLRIETPQGEEKWISDSAVPYIDENTGEVVGSLGIMVDITDRKHADKALRESELRYRQLVESAPDLIAICQNENFVFINPAGARLVGAASPEQVVGRSLLDFVAPATRNDFQIRLQRILQGEENPLINRRKIAATRWMYHRHRNPSHRFSSQWQSRTPDSCPQHYRPESPGIGTIKNSKTRIDWAAGRWHCA